MRNENVILFPIGRFVQGSLYRGSTNDMDGNPLIYKSGELKGQPRKNYFFAIAVEKKGEQHWAQTEWGAKIWAIGHAAFPSGAAQKTSFAWKIIDGDSTTPNGEDHKPCDYEGWKGCWVIRFSGGFAPVIYTLTEDRKTIELTEKNAINLGDYVHVQASVSGNESSQSPGIYINFRGVCFIGIGKRIFIGQDPNQVGFGSGEVPSACNKPSEVSGFQPPVSQPQAYVPPPVNPQIVTPPSPQVKPYPQILGNPAAISGYTPTGAPNSIPPPPPINPPANAMISPVRRLTEKAGAYTYEQLLKAGWSDETLIQHGWMIV